MLTIAAILSYKSPFVVSIGSACRTVLSKIALPDSGRTLLTQCVLHDSRDLQVPFAHRSEADAARRSFAVGDSDLFTALNAFHQWQRIRQRCIAQPRRRQGGNGASGGDVGDASSVGTTSVVFQEERQFCRKHFLDPPTLQHICRLRDEFRQLLVSIGFCESATEAESGGCNSVRGDDGGGRKVVDPIVRAIVAAGLYPQIARADPPTRLKAVPPPLVTGLNATARIHPSSILHPSHCAQSSSSRWIAFAAKVKTSQVALSPRAAFMARSTLLDFMA